MKQTSQTESWDGQRETLDDLALAVNYNEWIYKVVRPFLGQRIMEIGCGTGNITRYLTDHGHVCAVDVNKTYLDAARRYLKDRPNVKYHLINLERPLGSLRSFHPDSIVCVNVLEHLENDRQALQECHRLLPGGGHLLIFVPALQSIYGSMDKSYGHFRRYARRELLDKVTEAGFKVVDCHFLNLPGVPGWWFNGQILNRQIIPKAQMLLYDKLVPFIRGVEENLPLPFGLSLFCAAYKPASSQKP
jgi:SAM-dependent methyltransferase